MTAKEYRNLMIELLTARRDDYNNNHPDDTPYDEGVWQGFTWAIGKLVLTEFLVEDGE
ncbi:MAG: hypothetical protein J5725_10380 [Bacteroidales bacterium]|nr:hypothetical protein [Bacteroidales bacterium]